MSEQKQIELCERCQSETTGNFCANCGQPKTLKRIDSKYILSEISSVLNFDKGILVTIKELLIRPGQNVRNFIQKDRNRLVKPIIFIIICSLIYTLAEQFLHIEEGYINAGGFGDSAVAKIYEWIQSNYGYANIFMAIFIAIWIKIFFRKQAYNIFEIVILLCFVMGIGMLIYTVFGIVESVTHLKLLLYGAIAGFVYSAWAIGQFFDKKKIMNYLKALLSYLLGMISFYVLATFLGLGVDWLQKIW